ncbi:MAG TPA: AAA family ATPase [Gemmatimonadota bacterium]|nr:AAA family ATPase [Gemmatimonadota bacterium]
MEDQTRLLTVLFADLSGSVAATHDLDPEDAVGRVNQALDLMARSVTAREGRVDRYLGDGLLALFGAPLAHEDDPLRAISAAIAIRDAIGSIGLAATVGINTGEVYVGRVGGEAHREFTAMGPVVNLAARLQSKAEPGQILTGEATYRLARRAFGFSPLTLEIKGVPHPVVAYAVGEPLPRPELARGIEGLSAELTGRAREIARLVEALEGLDSGGRAAAIVGEAGVGKSRILLEVRNRSEAGVVGDRSDPPVWLEGRCFESTLSTGYGPFVDLLRSHFAWRVREDQAEREARVTRALEPMVSAGNLDAERAGDLESVLQHLLAAGGGTPRGPLAGASPELIRDQIFRAVRDFLRALADRHPVVVVLEDLHWADTLSIELAATLLDDLEEVPALLLCAYRPEAGPRIELLEGALERVSAGRRLRINLRPLSVDQTRGMLSSLLGGEALPESWRSAILEKAQGNPFFVEEVVRSLVDDGRIVRGNSGWQVAPGPLELEVPATVQGIVLSRIDRLSEPIKGVLQCASVIGRAFGTELLSAVSDGPLDLEVALRDLENHDLIYLEKTVPVEEYSFRHVFTRDTVYRSLLKARRAALHRTVGEAIERLYADRLDEHIEALAHHFERSTDDRKAAEYLVRAGEKATAAYSNEEAFAGLERALERLDGLSEEHEAWVIEARRRIRVCLGDLLERTGRHDEAVASYRAVLAGMTSPDPPARARLLRRIGASLQVQRRFPESLAAFQEALDALEGIPPAGTEATWRAERLDTVLGKLMLHYFMAAQAEIWGTIDRYREEFLAHGSPLQRGRLYNVMAVAGLQRERYVASSETVENARRAWETIEPSGVLHEAGHARFVYGFASLWAGRLEDADRELSATLALAERIGDLTLESRCVTYLALTHRKRGDITAARRYARRALEVAEAGGMTEYLAAAHAHLAWSAGREGRWDETEREGRAALELWEQIGGPYRLFLWMPVWPLLEAALARGRLEEAERHARVLLDPERQPMPEKLQQALEAATTAAESGESDARDRFSRLAELARVTGHL